MRSSKSRSRSKSRNRSVGNIVNRVFDSSGPEGKVRGTPQQIIEKYNQLARDAQLAGDRVATENFQQHAEHYLRMLGEAQKEQDNRREQQEQENRQRQAERDRERAARQEQRDNGGDDGKGDGKSDDRGRKGQDNRADDGQKGQDDGKAQDGKSQDKPQAQPEVAEGDKPEKKPRSSRSRSRKGGSGDDNVEAAPKPSRGRNAKSGNSDDIIEMSGDDSSMLVETPEDAGTKPAPRKRSPKKPAADAQVETPNEEGSAAVEG